jgi:hypothetical protein
VRRSLGAYRIPPETGLLIASEKRNVRKAESGKKAGFREAELPGMRRSRASLRWLAESDAIRRANRSKELFTWARPRTFVARIRVDCGGMNGADPAWCLR